MIKLVITIPFCNHLKIVMVFQKYQSLQSCAQCGIFIGKRHIVHCVFLYYVLESY